MLSPDLIPVIHAINAGDKAHARRLLQPILKGAPDAEAWYQASRVTEKPEHEIACLKRAIAADPRHMDARRRLNELDVTRSAPPLATEPTPPKPRKPPELKKVELAPLKKERRKKRSPWLYVPTRSRVILPAIVPR